MHRNKTYFPKIKLTNTFICYSYLTGICFKYFFVGLPSMVEPNPLVWVMGIIGGILIVVCILFIGVWWARARDRQTRMNTSTKTVTHIVSKENNPDLLSKNWSLLIKIVFKIEIHWWEVFSKRSNDNICTYLGCYWTYSPTISVSYPKNSPHVFS